MQCPNCSRTVPTGEGRCPFCRVAIPLSEGSTLHLDPVEAPPSVPSGPRTELTAGSLFADRFLIVEKIGEGGMGVVYKALDTHLDQPVALKMIRPAVAREAAYLERLRDEVRIARRITHPNVCRVHDIGEAGGRLYLSMEWIQGETLHQLLSRAGVLDQDRALEIAGRIVAALAEAHAQGVIHRDLKPDNVMIDEQGNVRVMDFGIATLADAQRQRPGGEGVAGTPRYMAPEQRRGEPLDGRADLYALGLLLREMLTGERLESGGAPRAGLRPGMRKGLPALLESLLADDRDERPPSAEAVLRTIEEVRGHAGGRRRWKRGAALVMTGCAVVAALLAYESGWGRFPKPPPAPDPMARSFYVKGMDFLREHADAPRAVDSAIAMLRRAVEADPDMAPAWAALGEALWKRFEAAPGDATREEADAAVARAFDLAPDLPDTHNARGRGFVATGRFVEAAAEFRQAVAQQADFDAAWSNLGGACEHIPGAEAEGLAAHRKAIALKPAYPTYWIYLGLYYEHLDDWDSAVEADRKAAELRPDSDAAWNNLGGVLLRRGRYDEAIAAFERSFQLKETPEAHTNLGTAYYYAGRYREAAEHYRLATELSPRDAVYWRNLGDAETMLGHAEGARHAFRLARVLARERVAAIPLDARARRQLAVLCAKTGDTACALEEGARAGQLAPDDPSVLFANAVVRTLAGRPGEALDFLERAVNRGVSRQDIDHDPDLRTLHKLPRYREIVARAR